MADSRTVLVRPLVQSDEPRGAEPPTLRALPVIAVSRVPCAFEALIVGGETLRVISVKHVAGGDADGIAAELHCERLPARDDETERAGQ